MPRKKRELRVDWPAVMVVAEKYQRMGKVMTVRDLQQGVDIARENAHACLEGLYRSDKKHWTIDGLLPRSKEKESLEEYLGRLVARLAKAYDTMPHDRRGEWEAGPLLDVFKEIEEATEVFEGKHPQHESARCQRCPWLGGIK